MFKWWQNRQQRKIHRPAAEKLYAAASAASRAPTLFTDMGVPDSFDGRFDSLLLHTAPIFLRLQQMNTPESQALSQQFFDVLFINIELSVREAGISDLATARHVKRMMTACQGRTLVYGNALQDSSAEADNILSAALRRNLYGTLESVNPNHLHAMNAYFRGINNDINGLPPESIMAGQIFYRPVEEKSWPNAA